MKNRIDFPSINNVIEIYGKKNPSKYAVLTSNEKLTFFQLSEITENVARNLYLSGLKKGDRIATFSDNSLALYVLYLACARAGVTVIPINFRSTGDEILSIHNRTGFKFLFTERQIDDFNLPKDIKILTQNNNLCDSRYINFNSLYKKSKSSNYIDNHDIDFPWFILFTSGSSGKPKGVIRSQRSFINFFLTVSLDFCFSNLDNSLIILPLCHINALFFSLTFTYIGASVSITNSRNFSAQKFFEHLQYFKPSFISLIPTHYYLLSTAFNENHENAKSVSSIKRLLCSSAPVTKELKRRIKEMFSEALLFEEYGSTEAGRVTILYPDEQDNHCGSIGRETTGSFPIKLIDENGNDIYENDRIGEIYCKTVSICDGYLDNEMNITSDGYFPTKDMAYRDASGYYYLIGRKEDTIITGGEKVFPGEVENVIKNILIDIIDVYVIGIPDEKWGERVIAIIVSNKNLQIDNIINKCKDKLSLYKIPKDFIVIPQDKIPKLANGKVDKVKLKEIIINKN